MKPKKSRVDDAAAYPTAKDLTEDLGGTWNETRRTGKAKCPAHDDSNPSLDITEKNGRTLVYCQVCQNNELVFAVLRAKGVWPEKRERKVRAASGTYGKIVATYGYQLEDGTEHFQVCRIEPGDDGKPKKFVQRRKPAPGDKRSDIRDGWVWKLPEENRYIPFHLPEVIEGIGNEQPIFIVEGEKDADNLAKLGLIATCNAGGAKKWRPDHAKHFRDADVIIIPDNDQAGRDHVNEAWKTLRVAARRVRILELPGLKEKGDVSDWLEAGGTVEKLWELVESTARDVTNVVPFKDPTPVSETPRKSKVESGGDDPEHWNIEPWEQPVDGDVLLTDIADVIERYMVIPRDAACALALWVMHAWSVAVFDISPILAVISPTKRCGKSTLLTILLYLTPRSSPAGNISAAAVYRYVESKNPTLILNEADSFMVENEHMRNVMNAAHLRPLAYVIRMEGEGSNMKPRRYSVFGPKIVAAINALADTVMDRSVKITLRRKQKGEKRARLRYRDNDEFICLRRKAMRWAEDNAIAIGASDPEMPDSLNDRAADNWRPLMSIAAIAGGEWPKVAVVSAKTLTGTIEDDDRGTRLLADIKKIFDEHGVAGFSSQTLVAHLIQLPDAPWVEWRRDGKAISARGVARILNEFEIRPRPGRDSNGYLRKDFEEAWQSYL